MENMDFARLGNALQRRAWTLAVAESCTGGLIGHLITNTPGSSVYFLGGIVAYAYQAKENLLGVDHELLVREGAVSEGVALAMARGARQAFSADVALSVTGIAGPGGGEPLKPVGLTWIALSSAEKTLARRFLWSGEREANKVSSALAALDLLGALLDGEL